MSRDHRARVADDRGRSPRGRVGDRPYDRPSAWGLVRLNTPAIADELNARRWSLSDLAREIGWHPSRASQVMSGKREFVRRRTAQQIADAFSLKIERFLR